MSRWPTAEIHGQESFLLRTREVDLALTRTGGMLAPVTFFPAEPQPVRPYAVAPWAEEELPCGTPAMLRALRGDFFCSAFGENVEPYRGAMLPPHGESANRDWQPIDRRVTKHGCWMRLGMDLPAQGGVCTGITALLEGQSVVYQRHDLAGVKGPVTPGHHATLAFPEVDGAGRLSFSSFICARTFFEPLVAPGAKGASWLTPDMEITDLCAVRGTDGTLTDLARFPSRSGFEDVAIVCADPALDFAWSAVTFPESGHVWFALRDPKVLASTLLWFSNGGRRFPPWNGRHVNVMGIEDVTAYFHVGLAASCRPNPLSARGVRTCLEPDASGRVSVTYIQGVARVPASFDRVASIERTDDGVLLRAESGGEVEHRCAPNFLRTGQLRELELP